MRQVAKGLLASMLVFSAVGTTGEALSQEAARLAPSTTVLASFPLGNGHEVQLIEYFPGMTGVAETGIPIFGTQAVTPELGHLSLTDLYRHFASKSAPVPQSVLAADARAAAMAKSSALKFTPAHTNSLDSANGDFGAYTSGEAANFYLNYCSVAMDCILGCDNALAMSPYPIPWFDVYFLLGSDMGYPAGVGIWKWSGTRWLNVLNTTMAPGTIAYFTASSPTGNSWWIAWNMWGAGADTTVGIAPFY